MLPTDRAPGANGIELQRLDLFAGVPDSRGRTNRVMKIARQLNRQAVEDPDDIASGDLLPLRATAEYFLHFHIDRLSPSKTARTDATLLFHLTLARQPKTKAPRELVERRAKGITCEWFLSELAGLLDDEKPVVAADAHFKTNTERRQRVLYAQPIEVGAQIMQLCGAEYRGVGPAEAGLHKVRWSERRGTTEAISGVDVWMSYAFHWDGDRDLWEQEKGRCANFAQQAL